MKKLVKVLGVSLAVGALVVGCEETKEVKPVSNASNQETVKPEAKEEATTPKEKKIPVDTKVSYLGLDIEIKAVVFTDDAVGLHLVAKNTGSKAVEGFFPDQGNIKMGDLQLSAQPEFEGHLPTNGRVEPGAKFEAPLVYTMPQGQKLDPSDIKKLEVNLGEVSDVDFMKTEQIKFDVKVR
jgi:hypothetical protein